MRPGPRSKALQKGETQYFTGKPCKRGHIAKRQTVNGKCVDCASDDKKRVRDIDGDYIRAKERLYAATQALKPDYAEKNRARAKQWRLDNPERYKQQMLDYAVKNSAKAVAKAKAWNAANPDVLNACRKRWNMENPDKRAAIDAKRRAMELQATPKWLTKAHFEAMSEFYTTSLRFKELTGQPHHVDHIVPLVNKKVCGLHVPWNLQVLTANENLKKSNKL